MTIERRRHLRRRYYQMIITVKRGDRRERPFTRLYLTQGRVGPQQSARIGTGSLSRNKTA